METPELKPDNKEEAKPEPRITNDLIQSNNHLLELGRTNSADELLGHDEPPSVKELEEAAKLDDDIVIRPDYKSEHKLQVVKVEPDNSAYSELETWALLVKSQMSKEHQGIIEQIGKEIRDKLNQLEISEKALQGLNDQLQDQYKKNKELEKDKAELLEALKHKKITIIKTKMYGIQYAYFGDTLPTDYRVQFNISGNDLPSRLLTVLNKFDFVEIFEAKE